VWAVNVADSNEERRAQCDLLRDVFGYPFRPASLDPALLAWRGGLAVAIAAEVYEERAFDRLPILADALEEAGCTDREVLLHCRGPAPHARGCWVVDRMLSKDR
jgi:hypothetical protein